MHRYTAAEEQNRLVLTAKEGSMKLFFYELDDLHQRPQVRYPQAVSC